MKMLDRLVFLLLPLLLVIQFGLSEPSPIKVVNAHESVQGLPEVEKLQTVMTTLGIVHTALHAIPQSLLVYTGEDVQLAEVTDNNELLEEVTTDYPEEFSYFCSINPLDPDRLEVLASCLEQGALGVKLYIGYSYAHVRTLDDSRLQEFYTELEKQGAPLMLPVNTSEYEDELRNLLTLYPDLTVICSHFCLSSKDLSRVSALMTDFPNLYVDTSFGSTDFVEEGFQTISENQEGFLDFFESFQDRILFATDSVLTNYEGKTVDWISALYSDYLAILQEEEFESTLFVGATFAGLNLPQSIQRKVFYQNWMELIRK